MNKSALGNFLETLKYSVRFAGKHYLSFFLATLGVLVITFVLFSAIIFVISLPWVLQFGLFDDFFGIFEVLFDDIEGMTVIWTVFTFGTTILLPFLIALGAMFGMGQEIIESGGTSAEGVLIWYKQKFIKLAMGGIVQFCIITIPIAVGYLLAYQYYYPSDPTRLELTEILGLTYIWIVVSSGAVSMVYPALIDGFSVFSALKRSFSMALQHFDSVFSIWLVFVSMVSLLLGPIALQEIFQIVFIAEPFYESYIILAAIALAFLITPVSVLAISRTYLLLSADYDDSSEEIDRPKKEEYNNET